MTKSALLPAALLAFVLAMSASAQSQSVAITTSHIADVMTRAGLTTSPDQVTLLANVVAATSDPILKVDSVTSSESGSMKVRLSCKESTQCLPFFVYILKSAPATSQSRQASMADLPKTPIASSGTTFSDGLPVVRSGSTVILLLEGDHVHIQMHAVCLHKGSIGETIRVSSKDHHEIFFAQILDATHVRGTL